MAGRGRRGGRTARPTGGPRTNGATKPAVEDARLRIIRKNRKNLKDARDKLAQIAKKSDARAKLLKLRQGRMGYADGASVQSIGQAIIKKTDRNGKISLSTNKNQAGGGQGGINLAVRKELGLLPAQRQLQKKIMARRPLHSEAPRAPNVFQRTINMDVDTQKLEDFRVPIIQRTIRNDVLTSPVRHFSPSNLYSLSRSSRLHQPMEATRQIARDDVSDEEWQYISAAKRAAALRSINKAPEYIDLDAPEDEYVAYVAPAKSVMLRRPKTASIGVGANIHSRLDTAPVPVGQSQGILAHAKPKQAQVGHRIVVSNLQPSVTQDDIRELFEDIGQLLVSRLVRPGTAEVIYKNLKDAQKAVDTYHNRQLDGQPMKCLLVNSSTTTVKSPAKLSSSDIVQKASSSITSQKLVPDLSTFHKVLFHRS